jgi:hypothetical protein
VDVEYHRFQITDPQGPVAGDLEASRTGLVSADGGAIGPSALSVNLLILG